MIRGIECHVVDCKFWRTTMPSNKEQKIESLGCLMTALVEEYSYEGTKGICMRDELVVDTSMNYPHEPICKSYCKREEKE